jgi:hypothetical protein
MYNFFMFFIKQKKNNIKFLVIQKGTIFKSANNTVEKLIDIINKTIKVLRTKLISFKKKN